MMPRSDMGTDEDLVRKAIEGDRVAQSGLWRAHRQWLAAVLLAYKPRWTDLEDLMQDVAVKFASKIHTLRDPGAFRPWIRRMAINAARESARRGSATDESGRSMPRVTYSDSFGENLADHEGARPDGDEATTMDEAHGLLAHALTLPPEFREPLIMRCVHGMGCEQIAAILELPLTTVETRLSRARRMLREEWTAIQEQRSRAGVGGGASAGQISVQSRSVKAEPVVGSAAHLSSRGAVTNSE